MCGGTRDLRHCLPAERGLSPRVRGNLARIDLATVGVRSIPACAGEPNADGTWGPAIQGLSPRVRGNPGDDRG